MSRPTVNPDPRRPIGRWRNAGLRRFGAIHGATGVRGSRLRRRSRHGGPPGRAPLAKAETAPQGWLPLPRSAIPRRRSLRAGIAGPWPGAVSPRSRPRSPPARRRWRRARLPLVARRDAGDAEQPRMRRRAPQEGGTGGVPRGRRKMRVLRAKRGGGSPPRAAERRARRRGVPPLPRWPGDPRDRRRRKAPHRIMIGDGRGEQGLDPRRAERRAAAEAAMPCPELGDVREAVLAPPRRAHAPQDLAPRGGRDGHAPQQLGELRRTRHPAAGAG